MNKFFKRIAKTSKNPKNVLVVGDGFGNLERLCENFQTIFIIPHVEIKYRRKNLIFKENFDNVDHLPDINVIFMNRNQSLHVYQLQGLISKYRPSMFVEGQGLFDKAEYKFLQNLRYGVTQVFSDYHLWTPLK